MDRSDGTSIKAKINFMISSIIACCWLVYCVQYSVPWIKHLSHGIGPILAIVLVTLIALIPSYMNSFSLISFILDKRPSLPQLDEYPHISILIPFYNEEKYLAETIESTLGQDYKSKLEIILINDGSTDKSLEICKQYAAQHSNIRIVNINHAGKAAALNAGLQKSQYSYIVSVDADTTLLPNAIERIIAQLLLSPGNTVAISGSIFIKNSHASFMTRLQLWDYLFAISPAKRVQSSFQGTLVAPGAFSCYNRVFLEQAGGWRNTVGEDIVLTWALLQKKRYRINHAVEAIAFTNGPKKYRYFFRQRSRWARGMFEALRNSPKVLITPRLTTFFIYFSVLSSLIEVAYLLFLIPGIILACIGKTYMVTPLTLAVIPLILLYYSIYFIKQRKILARNNLKIEPDVVGFILFIICYNTMLIPASMHGYITELLNMKKKW